MNHILYQDEILKALLFKRLPCDEHRMTVPLILGRRSLLAGLAGLSFGAAATAVWRSPAWARALRPELPAPPDLPVARSPPGIAGGILSADRVASGPAGNQLGYAGRYPGPVIRLREG